jgi:predicted metal-dependent peptidase
MESSKIMTQNYDAIARAEGDINIAILRLLEKYPFHARILEQAKIRARPEVGTMAVSVSGVDLMLYHNPEYVLLLPPEQLRGVLLHEVHHVLLGHVTADPADFPDEWARTMAEEVTVNEFVKEPLPKGVVVLMLFPGLPQMESTQQRYNRLRKNRRRPPIQSPAASGKPLADTESDLAPPKETGANLREMNMGTGVGTTVDDHSVWAEARQDLQRSKDVIRDAIQQAALEAGVDNIPKDIREAMGIGSLPSEAEREMGQEKKGRLDWRRRLRRYVGKAVEVRPVFNRPPRRFPHMAGILPGRRRQPVRPKIMAVIDTSSSITDDLLKMIDGELARLAKAYAVKVVECDAMIHAVYDYKPIKKVQGDGGTDLCPPLEKDFLYEHRPDLLIYFTDGDGPAPARSPKMPVIWCLTPDGDRPTPWGKVIQMEKPSSGD